MRLRLSALTPPVVDRLYNIGEPDERPTFLWLVGSPGAGKSSGHARAIEAGYLPAGNYATINLDILLESLTPFRAASSMAHYTKHAHPDRDLKFASIGAYGSRKENMGLFRWYNAAPIPELADVRAEFMGLRDQDAPQSLVDINDAALARAIQRSVNIVYETTLTKSIKKVDDVMSYLAKQGPQYRVVFYHVTGTPEDIAARIRARQEYGMPYEEMPYYRYVTTRVTKIATFVEQNAAGFAAARKKYGAHAVFDEFVNPLDPTLLEPERPFDAAAELERIERAYGPKQLSSSWRISRSRTSSRRLRYSTPSSERRRRTRRVSY